VVVFFVDSFILKHWKCMSWYDLESIQECYNQDSFDIPSELSDELQKVVHDTIKDEEVVEPPKPSEDAPKKSRKKQAKVKVDSELETPKPKKGKKRAAPVKMESDSEPEYVPRKTRSRAPEVAPNVARIQATAESMRTEAGR
jgi:hypothetical protein